MALFPITVNTPAEALPHIYAEDDAAIYEAISGGDCVYELGDMLKATVLNNNAVRIGNGVLSIGGHIARMKYGDYEDMTIDNGVSGKNRNDLIVARFSTTGARGTDTFTLEVKKGAPVTGTAADPAVTKGDLYKGDKLREFPLYRVCLTGISITKVDQLFTARKTNEQLEKELAELNSKLDFSGYTTVTKVGFFGDDGVFTALKSGMLIATHCLRCPTLNNNTTGFIAVEIAINGVTKSRGITAGGSHFYDGANCVCIVPVNAGDKIMFRVDRNTDTSATESTLQFVII